VLERFALTLLSVKLETGRTHQIRLHLSHIKYPIVGDPGVWRSIWAAAGANLTPHRHPARFKRQALHAATLGIRAPALGERLTLQSPVPPDFAQLARRVARMAGRGTGCGAFPEGANRGVRGECFLARAEWPAPPGVRALSTFRAAGQRGPLCHRST